MNTQEIAEKLISIPSWVDSSTNEGQVALWLFEYLKKFPWLKVELQEFEKGRYNVIAKDKFETRVLACDHIDTVQPRERWKTNPVKPKVIKGSLFGLGATDTKGNIATLLKAIETVGPTKGFMLILYADEEYDFKGAKALIGKFKEELEPTIIASADGGDLELGNACRGLIEVIFKTQGIAGHSANPVNGVSAITGSLKAYLELDKELSSFATLDLGRPTTNLAWINGGQTRPGSNELGKEGNVIPDFAEFAIEIRNPNPKLNAQSFVKIYKKLAKNQGLEIVDYKIRHDLGAWITKKEELKEIEKLLPKVVYTPAATRGYVDLQMFWETFGKPLCFTFGAGIGKTAHKPNEYIKIKDLEKGVSFWTAFIKMSCPLQ